MEIGDSLGLRMVAEGIETSAQLRRLSALSYRYGQGYLFSRPLPAGAVPDLLATSMLPEEVEPIRLSAEVPPDATAHGGYLDAVADAAARQASHQRRGATRARRREQGRRVK